jgi:hypothetical protein
MYAAAELLGVPHLIAKTIPMKLIGGNGQEIEGTFMMKGKGMDPNNLPDEALDINERALTGTNGKGFKDLADLQVLDYICGNVDRHGGNMFYQFDRNGKFCGVQGIDNDCAFGLLVPKGNRNVNKMVGPEYMKIVSRSMYNKVMDLTPAELRFALRGFALSEKELHCAVRRTQKLQEELKKGTVKVVEDKDFKKIGRQQLDQLRVRDADGSGLNLFARAFGMIKTFGIQRSSQKKLYQDLDDMTALREQNRALPGATAREEENADLLLDQMALVTKTGWWRFHKGTSPQFEAMRQSVRNYKEYQQRIRSRIDEANTENRKNDPDAPIDAMVTKEELEEMARLRKDMREKADTYLEGRQNVKYNSYTNMRKEIARMVKAYGSAGETVSADEIRTQEKQMKRAVEESDRRLSQQQKEHQNGPVAGL